MIRYVQFSVRVIVYYYINTQCNQYKVYIKTSAVKRLIAINRIQNKRFVYKIYVRVLCIFIMFIQIHTHACIYLRKICYIYILNIFIYDINYMNLNIYM